MESYCLSAYDKLENAKSLGLMQFPLIRFAAFKSSFKILEVCMAGDKMLRLNNINEVIEHVKSIQDAAFITNGLATTTLGGSEEATLTLSVPGESMPRYTIYILDQAAPAANKYGVFIVPQGRESEWLFGTLEGRKQLAASVKHARLAVATLARGQRYDSLDAVKDELAESAKRLAPKGFTGQIPFLSLGSDVGKREKVYEGHSKSTGYFVVEDVEVNGSTFRRLIFLDNQFLVQSEAKLKTSTEGAKIAVLGLGGGSLCMFLRKCFEKLNVVAVDIDEAMLEIAKNHFELKVDNNLQVLIEDGINFLAKEIDKESQYDAILFDMDSKDSSVGLSCPPRQFLQEDVMANVKKLLSKKGQFILNLVCRDTKLHDSIVSNLKQHFSHLVSIKLEEEVNEVILASNRINYDKEQLDAAVRLLNATARNKNLVKIKCLDLKDFISSVNIIS
ncbi:Methyltransferase-like protein 13 [Eumeta japonica]|uniref:Methyltransferase-like protein 13 n=1 Tax=Eumeta variegata TaxID=151549 RepID=A0A4C1W9L8_EUMVA|nr:Methyltransferase-like protein 13 [Eumeta japonica]